MYLEHTKHHRQINKSKMTLKAFYMTCLFKHVEHVDAICVFEFLYNESMVWILCSKPSNFCDNEPFLYPDNLIGVLQKLIFLRGGLFVNHHSDVIFT